mmetsp:Transcript_23701/g.67440  ORF Transcript_23701/g.67440 Transcript_23701/m.67440 type:complete len:210 (-) Transcript_23701:62-691(-)
MCRCPCRNCLKGTMQHDTIPDTFLRLIQYNGRPSTREDAAMSVPYAMREFELYAHAPPETACSTARGTGGSTLAPASRPRVEHKALAFTYKALPCNVFPFTATKPLMCSARRASMRLSTQVSMFLNRNLPTALARFETTLPRLFLINASRFKPPEVFSLLPRSTIAFAMRPRATLLPRFDFVPATFAFIAVCFGRAMACCAEDLDVRRR